MEDEYSFNCSYIDTKAIIKKIGLNPMITEYPNILLIYDDFLNAIKLNSSIKKINCIKDYIINPNSTPQYFFNKILIILNDILLRNI